MKLGILADTHGRLPTQIHDFFQGVEAILHAGDVGRDEVFIELQTIAPVHAVRGNMDLPGSLAWSCPEEAAMPFAGVQFLIVHDLGPLTPANRYRSRIIQYYQPQVIIFGHTHVPYLQTHQNVLYCNPGSAASGRSGHPPSVGLLEIVQTRVAANILPINKQ